MTRWAGTDERIVVDVRSLGEAARLLAALHRRVEGTIREARGGAVDAFTALPDSDVRDAYGFCWGRWSQTLLNTAQTLQQTQRLTGQAAGLYDAVDRPAS